MNRNILNCFSVAMLSIGVLLATPGALSQMHGGSSMGGQSGGMNQPGMSNNMRQNGQMGAQNTAEIAFIADVKRNSKVETDLSKLALKNSSNDNVKKLAQQVISENRRNEMALTGATAQNGNSAGPMFEDPIPSQTKQAEKQMKKLTGTQFDGMYLSQMNGYVKNDQKIVSDASSMDSADMGSLTMQLRNTADDRVKQIEQVAESENMKLQ